MNATRGCQRRLRSRRANTIADLAPALMVLLFFFFFPLIDLLAVVLSYAFLMVLNYNQLHEAALVPWKQAIDPTGTVCKGIPDQWANGMGHFVKMSGNPSTDISYKDGPAGADNIPQKIVTVRTTIIANPFLPIPIPWLEVPGMNTSMTLSTGSERQMENPDYGQ